MYYDLHICEWQMVGHDEWVFGMKLRGIVRVQYANVYFDEDSNNPRGCWVWCLLGELCDKMRAEGRTLRGVSASCSDAILDAEEAMGLT